MWFITHKIIMGRSMRRFISLISFLTLCLFGNIVLAETEDESRFLERIEINRLNERVEIVIGLAQAYRYISHTPADYGDILRVRLSKLNRAVSDERGVGGRRTLNWKATPDIPLYEVRAESDSTAGIYVVLRFKTPVKFQARSGPEKRTLIISLPTASVEAKKPEEIAAADADILSATSGDYTVSLMSSRKRIDINTIEPHELFKRRQLFVVRTIVNGEEYYRLRLGFFTLKEAKKIHKKLHTNYKRAWIDQANGLEIERANSGFVDLLSIPVTPIPGSKQQPVLAAKLVVMMETARDAMQKKEYGRAAAIYSKITEYPLRPYQRDALERLGLARERKNQLAHAKAEYEKYLKLYPKGKASERVRQRLAGIMTAHARKKDKLELTEITEEKAPTWQVFGNFAQFYRKNRLKTEDASTETTVSSLDTDLDINARRRTKMYDLRLRFSGRYDNDFIRSDKSFSAVSSLYADLLTRDGRHSARIGRQTRTSGGILGRFDGFYYGNQAWKTGKINFVNGWLVDSTKYGINHADKHFYGTSLDWTPQESDWSFNTFLIEQRAENFLDRRAIGGEIKYFNRIQSFFGLIDYDIYFDELNIAYIIANRTLTEKTKINMVFDYRKSPIITLNNALQGQTARSLSDLHKIHSKKEMRQLAKDRAVVSKNVTVGLSQEVSDKWQVTGDATVYSTSSSSASGGVPATESTGDDYYFSLTAMGNNLIKQNDLIIIGARYSDTENSDKTSITANMRYPIYRYWRVNPRIKMEYRDKSDDTEQIIIEPSFRTTYRWKKQWNFDLEFGMEWTKHQLIDATEHSLLYYFYGGYRLDF